MQPPTERSPRQAPPLRDSPNVLEFTLVGAGALLRYCATEMSRRGHRVIAVFTDDGSTAESITAEFGVPVQSVDILCSSQVQTTCDVLLSVGNLRKLPVNVLSDARVAAVNYHDGPLPRYPGLNAPSWALISGESEHGMTWHMMTGSVDAGPILAQRRFRVETDDTSFTLGARCYEAAIDSFPELLDRLEQGDFPKHAEALTTGRGTWRDRVCSDSWTGLTQPRT